MIRAATLWPVLLLPVCPAWAEFTWEPPPLPARSSISLDFVTDDEEGWNRQLGVSLASPLDLQFNLVYGESVVSSSVAELHPDYWSAGFASDPLNPVSVDFTYDRWGEDKELTIDGLRLGISYNTEDLALGLLLQQRSIKLYLREWVQPYLSYFEVDSEDVGIVFSYYGFSDWALSAEYLHYRYSANLSVLAEDYRVLFLFPLTTLELTGGLYTRHVLLSATWFHPDVEIGLQWFKADSAVDGSRAEATTLYTAFELTHDWMLRLQTGAQQVDYAEDSILSFGLGVDYFW